MSYGLDKLSTRTKLVAGALALILAGASHAATQVGGGATLPSIGYVGNNAATMLQVTGSNINSGSLLGVWSSQSGNGASYCLTGSGAGKNILAGATGFNVQNDCVKDSNGTVHGFGAANVGRTDLTRPNFAGSDSPLTTSDFTNYVNNHPSGYYPTQFPAIAGAIALSFHLTDSQGNKVTSSEVNFSDTQVCQIFSGTITNWSDTRLASAFSLPAGDSIVSAPINVQYRSDGSGTSFGFSNHLANVCGAINGTVFETNQAFTSVVANFFPSGLPNGDGTTTPKWTGSSGNPGVANAIGNTANSIGYVETANALVTNPGLQFADVNGLSPQTNFGGNLTINAADLVFNNAITGTDSNGVATYGAISGAPSTQCIALVKPANYAKSGTSIVSSSTYGIVAISYLLGNASGNGTDLSVTRSLLTAPYTSAITSNVTTVGSGKGLAFLTLGRGSFTSAQVSNCLAN